MELAWGVLGVYAALVIWLGLLIYGVKSGSYKLFLGFGIALLLYLNLRYLVEGAVDSIAFFIGIYDVPINLGASESQTAAAMSKCVDNACTVWGERYQNHPAWGVAFHERFLNGSQFRSNLLYGHIIFNSIVFVLMHVQLLRPGGAAYTRSHRIIGRVSFLALTISVVCAAWLASEHGSVAAYGGDLAKYGFWFMSFCVYACAVMGIAMIWKGDAERHRIWMIRFVGSMWGSFWIFRVMLFVLDPLLRDVPAAAILSCIWLSAPIGILVAEAVRRRLAKRSDASHLSAEGGARQVPAGT